MNKYNPNIHHRRSIRLKGYDYSQAGLYFITICCENRIYRFGDIENGEMILNELGKMAYNEWIKLSERFTNFELDVFQIMPNHMHGIIVLKNVGATLAVAPNDNNVAPDDNDVIQNDNDVIQNDNNVAPNSNDVAPNDSDIRAGASPAPTIFDIDVAPNNNDVTQNDSDIRAGASPIPTIFDIVGAYKSLVANGCLKIYKSNNQTMGKLWQRNYYEHIIRNEQSYERISNYIINNPSKWNDDKFYKK